MHLSLNSSAFQQGGTIPQEYTCQGIDQSPPFAWSNVPEGTLSFLLVCDDPDAPGGVFHHWAAYGIPADWRSLEAGYGPETPEAGFRQAINDFGKPGYSGPCPPGDDAPHHYHFRLSALSEPDLPVSSAASCEEVITLARPYVLEFVELVGLYGRR